MENKKESKKQENIVENDNKVETKKERKHRGKGSKELNNRERDILKYIEKQVAEQGYAPSVREIGKAVGLSSTATVHSYLSKLEEKGYIDKCIKFEEEKGMEYLYTAVTKMLRLTNDDNLIVTRILENTPKDSVVFLTGVGKVFPFVRSHNVLNNLHQVLDSVPVVMFYPGTWNGQSLSLFGTISDGNYYRAFPLIV